MKGIEGLALKYILLIVVAALVIGTAFAIVTTFTSQASISGNKLNQTISGGLDKTNEAACHNIGCTWTNATHTCACN